MKKAVSVAFVACMLGANVAYAAAPKVTGKEGHQGRSFFVNFCNDKMTSGRY